MGFAMAFTLTAAALAPASGPGTDRAAIIAACLDNIEGQLEGNVERVERTLHPTYIAHAVQEKPGHAPLEMETETRDQLIANTRSGALKQPRAQWQRSCQLISQAGNAAVVRLETADFVSFDHMGRFDGKWLLVQSFWSYRK